MPITPEQLKERAKPWIDPIAGASPAGTNSSAEPRYEMCRGEISKLEGVSGVAPKWNEVVAAAGELLQEKSKDLLLAAWMTYGLYNTKGLDGLLTGVALLNELVDQYWPNMYPEAKRIRGRVNAIAWLMDRLNISLPTHKVAKTDRDALTDLSAASKIFAGNVRAKFEQNTPALAPLLENVERLMMDLPQEAAPAPPPPPAAASPVAPPPGVAPPPAMAPPPAAAAQAAQIAPPPGMMPPPAASNVVMPQAPTANLDGAENVVNFLRECGTSLARAASVLRNADASDPTAYRVLRTGLWLAMSNAPPAQGPKTSVPAPPPALKSQLEKIAANAKWAALLEETESAMNQHRFWLDLQFFSWQALQGLGHNRAKDVLVAEVSSLLKRMPNLPNMQYSDGTPFADPQTKGWLESDVIASGQGGGGGKGDPAQEAELAAIAEAKGLMGKSQAAEAIALLAGHVAAAKTGQSRFRLRLALAKLCLQGQQVGLAKALFEALDKEAQEHSLGEWEPGLAAECLEGLITCVRTLAKGGKPLPPDSGTLYDRLCRIDPAAALRVGS
jgi:type VI secretion system protein VasJ